MRIVENGDAMPTSVPERESGQTLIEVRGLHVRFSRHEVLRDIHLAIPRGQTVELDSMATGPVSSIVISTPASSCW